MHVLKKNNRHLKVVGLDGLSHEIHQGTRKLAWTLMYIKERNRHLESLGTKS